MAHQGSISNDEVAICFLYYLSRQWGRDSMDGTGLPLKGVTF